MKYLKYFVVLLVSLLLVIFVFRLIFYASFDNVITDDNYWSFNPEDNQINNLDDINVTAKGFFNLFRGFNNYFTIAVDSLTKFNVFEAAAQSYKDIWILGAFLNFMSSVYTFIVYFVSLFLTLLQIIVDIVTYIFSIETFDINTTYVSIDNIG